MQHSAEILKSGAVIRDSRLSGWTIERDVKPMADRSHDFTFWHEDHDGENGLCGTASSINHAIEMIFDIQDGL